MRMASIVAALLGGMMLATPTLAEEIAAANPSYIGTITGDPEKDSFGFVAADLILKPCATVLLSEEARYVGSRTGDEEKDTFARIELRRKWTAEIGG